MKVVSTLLFYIILSSFNLFGQGSYVPPNADLSFPRTLVDRADIDLVRNNIISSEEKRQLYTNIFAKAMQTFPENNITNSERLSRGLIAREAAFVYLINRKLENGNLVPLSSIERQEFGDKVILLLESINTEVEVITGFSFYYNWQFRTNELSHYLVAYDLLRGGDVSSEILSSAAEKLQLFTGNFYDKTLQLYPFPDIPSLRLEFYSYNPNNHGIMYSSTLGLAGIVLGDLTSDNPIFQPISWINAGMWSLDHSLWEAEGVIPRVSDRGVIAGYAESPNYFGYGFKNVFPFIRAMWNFLPDGTYDYTFRVYPNPIVGNGNPQTITKSIRHPWYDTDYYNLYEWIKRIRMPNGRLPAIHDSGINYGTTLTSLSGQSSFHLPRNGISFNNVWVRTQYLCTPIEPGSYDTPLFQALTESGDLIFRNTYDDPAGTYIHFIGKNGIALYGAKGHHQADATSYQLFYNNENMLLDPGYPGAPNRLSVASAASHNLVLVNGEGPGLVTGEFVNQNNEVFIENYFDRPSLDYGELRGGWQGAEIVRKTMFVHNRFFVVSDFLTSSSPKNYSFQLHGNGLIGAEANSIEGKFLDNFAESKYLYSRGDDASLVSLTTARGGVDEFSTALDSAVTSGFRYHTKVLADKNGVNDTEYLTVHFPYSNEEEPILSKIFTSDSLVSVIHIEDEFYNNLVFTNAHDSNTDLGFPASSVTVQTNGNLNIVSLDHADEFKLGFVENGDNLHLNNDPVFTSDNRGDVYFEKIAADTFVGYVGQGGLVRFYNPVQLVPLAGPIENFVHDEEGGFTEITFSEAGDFELVVDSLFTNLLEIIDLQVISVTPNPSDGIFYINLEHPVLIGASYKINSVDGKPVKGKTSISGSEIKIDLSLFSSGIYILNIQDGRSVTTVKLLKE